MKLSVIILNYNVRYFLEQCLISVQKAVGSVDAEIIVVDNNSSDGSCEMVKTRFPKIKLLENPENIGFSKANNQAVKQAKGEYICILNPDTAVAENTFIQCLWEMENHAEIGILGLYMMDGTGNFLPESKRNIPTPKNAIKKLLGRGHAQNGYYSNNISPHESGFVDVLAGAFMFLKKERFDAVNGFDEDYFMYGEDVDISYKIFKAGYKNYYLGTSCLLHYKGESTLKDAAYFERFYGAMQIFYKKHFDTNILFDTSVNVALKVAKKLKKAGSLKKPILSNPVKITYLFTENLDTLKRLSHLIDPPPKAVSKVILQEDQISEAMLIFDVDYIPYSQIFMVMDKFRNNGNRFRIIPHKCNFMLGSDHSDEKGEVLLF